MISPFFITMIHVPACASRRKKDFVAGSGKFRSFFYGFGHVLRPHGMSVTGNPQRRENFFGFGTDHDRGERLFANDAGKFIIAFALTLTAKDNQLAPVYAVQSRDHGGDVGSFGIVDIKDAVLFAHRLTTMTEGFKPASPAEGSTSRNASATAAQDMAAFSKLWEPSSFNELLWNNRRRLP